VPTASAWIVPTLTAPRASAAAEARGTSSTCTSICRRFFPCLVSGTRWKARRVHPGGSMKDHASLRCTGSPPRMEDQNSASAAGFWQSNTTSSTLPIIFRAYRRPALSGAGERRADAADAQYLTGYYRYLPRGVVKIPNGVYSELRIEPAGVAGAPGPDGPDGGRRLF
jgi:hypothetical protein